MNLPAPLINSLQNVSDYIESDFLEAHTQPPVISVRKHPLKGSGLFEGMDAVPWCRAGRYLDKRPVFTLDPLFHAGAYYVQEASSMFLDYMFGKVKGDSKNLRVLDLCAAPGGKSTLIASLLDKDSLLVSNEVIRTRVPVLEENISRWGYMNTWVASNDARDFGKLNGYFDVIVADVPCSGSGLFRKDAKAVDEWSEANVALCCQRQKRILADSWKALKQGGVLIYSTCSYSAEENEHILDWMAAEFNISSINIDVPADWGIVTTYSPVSKAQGFRFFPYKLKGEGFFIAAIRKEDAESTVALPRQKRKTEIPEQKECAYLVEGDDWTCVPADTGYAAIRQGHEQDLELLKKILYLHKYGLRLGEKGAKEWVPHHDVAMSTELSSQLPVIELDKENALLYLKKEDIKTEVPQKGWYLVQYQGRALGWVKSLGNRFNNYLPKTLRIRMGINQDD